MKKACKVIAILLLIAAIYSCFMPNFFHSWIRMYEGDTLVDILDTFDDTMYEVCIERCQVLTWVLGLCWVACIGAIFFSLNKAKEHKLLNFSPVICLALFFAIVKYVTSTDFDIDYSTILRHTYKSVTVYSVEWMFYVSLALQIGAAVMMVIAMTSKNQSVSTIDAPSVPQKVSDADELRKYKELLDDGIISQDEFDEKKKQFLNQ